MTVQAESTRTFSIVARLTSANTLFVLFALVTGPLTARALGPDGRGALAAVNAPLSLAPYILGLGIPAFVTREIARRENVEEILGSVGLLYLLIGCAAMAGAIPVSDYFAQGREAVRIPLLIGFLTMPISMWTVLLTAIAVGQQRWRVLVTIRILPGAIGLVGTVALFALGMLHVAEAAALVLITGYVSILPVLGVLRGCGRPRVKRSVLRRSIRFGLPAWLWQLSNITNVRLDQVLMVSLTTSRELGLYAVAVSLVSVAGTFTAAMGTAMLPRIAAGDVERVPEMTRKSIVVTTCLNGTLAAGAPVVFFVLFGPTFIAATPMAWILCVAGIPATAVQVLTAAFFAAGWPRVVATSEIVAVVVTVGGLLLTLGPLGGIGAAIVSFAAYSLTLALLAVYAPRRFGGTALDYILPHREDVSETMSMLYHRLIRGTWTRLRKRYRSRSLRSSN